MSGALASDVFCLAPSSFVMLPDVMVISVGMHVHCYAGGRQDGTAGGI
jgi:hypothetical protein